MLTEEKRTLTTIGKDPKFKEIFKDLTLGNTLLFEDKSYILSCAILFLRHYKRDLRFTSYADIAYYIILKYSLKYEDYVPLYDFSMNFGFYPISNRILLMGETSESIINDCFNQIKLETYKGNGDYIETIEQHNQSDMFLINDSFEKGYIAPTSFGKSSLIVDYIDRLDVAKIVIVVPTKSLLMQTYKMIKSSNLNRKIIIHDEMYSDDDYSFIAIFTQERALRLLSKTDIHYDSLIIDEAHNLFNSNSRSVLLSRLVARNRLLNPHQKVVYLSPLIKNIENLSINNQRNISSNVIHFNIKEPEIFEYKLDNKIDKYNRFVNQFYPMGQESDYFDYILMNSRDKNFLYNYRPIKIESLAKSMCLNLPEITQTNQVTEVINILRREVHDDFYGVKYLKYGLIYLHGKIPDLIKEYLEFKYKNLPDIKYIVANSVILEGMNLPIDTLFIFNTYSLHGKELINLIGRVNRLNEIFDTSEPYTNLNKLLPKVHFINNEENNGRKGNMRGKIQLLRSRIFEDEVKNPTLDSFNLDDLSSDTKKDKARLIQQHEDFLLNHSESEIDDIRSYLIESGINEFYFDIDNPSVQILEKSKLIEMDEIPDWNDFTMMEKINYIIINDIEDEVSDFEVKRLKNNETRNYYENHMLISAKKSLNENINSQFSYFKRIARSGNSSRLYFGGAYGEEPYESVSFSESHNKVYVDLSQKNDTELVNLAVVKLKMEDDFVSFKLNKLIVFLFDYDLISEAEYNTYIYGTTDVKKINLTKTGLSINLISRLERDGQISNLSLDQYGNLNSNNEFNEFLGSVDDFYKFEINRHLE